MSSISRISSSSSGGSQESYPGNGARVEERQTTQQEKSAGRVKFEGSAKNSSSAELGTDANSTRARRMRTAPSSGGPKAVDFAASSRNVLPPLTPLTPLNRAAAEEVQRAEVLNRPVVYAYSSPNLAALDNPSNYEQARMIPNLVPASTNRTGGTYVDPLYRQLDPSVGSEKSNKPVWSLNQPLPHVLDGSLAGKMVQKNMDARSRASSRSGSRDVSRSGSMTSVNTWGKRFLRRGPSSKKLTDLEAGPKPIPNAPPPKAKSVHSVKRPQQASRSASGSGDDAHHNATFVLGDESDSASVAEAPRDIEKPVTDNISLPPSPPTRAISLAKSVEPVDGFNAVDGGGIGGIVETTPDDSSEEMVFPNYWAKIRYYMREPFAECFGTLVLVVFGVGSNLQATVSMGADHTFGTPGGSFESLSLAWGIGCMLGVYVAGGISGGHVNPAVTISMAIFRNFPWKKVPVYIVAQIFGAFFGGAMAFGYHWSSITALEGGKDIRTASLTGACLYTNPKSYVTWRNAFFDEFIGTSILVGCLMALLDDTNAPPTNGMTAFVVGLLVAGIGMALGYQTSFTINPARDLGPRIFAAMIGYGSHPFHITHWWWIWGGWLGPIGGGIAGALVYDLFIFTGLESPVNYPDNGYIEHRVNKIFFHSDNHQQNDGKSAESELLDHNSAETLVKAQKNASTSDRNGAST